ncbi:MAG: hypothetical protein H0T11_01425 [Chthoniobacterales bacterium]|nr:hypothetical protein [Chthoniobacterales bacterium]
MALLGFDWVRFVIYTPPAQWTPFQLPKSLTSGFDSPSNQAAPYLRTRCAPVTPLAQWPNVETSLAERQTDKKIFTSMILCSKPLRAGDGPAPCAKITVRVTNAIRLTVNSAP